MQKWRVSRQQEKQFVCKWSANKKYTRKSERTRCGALSGERKLEAIKEHN